MIYKHFFGRTQEGEAVTRFTLFNRNEIEVNLLSLGASMHSIRIPDKNGTLADILLGCDTPEDYLRSPHMGGTIGRCAGRLEGAVITLNGREYALTANEGKNHKHGGRRGYDRRLWKWRTADFENTVVFSYESPDGDEGYPGTLKLEASYTLTNEDALVIHYSAESDRDTVINIINHAYYNLGGEGSGTVCDHVLEIPASCYTPCNEEFLPTGEVAPVAGTPFDFRAAHRIGERLRDPHPQMVLGQGYDVNYVLDVRDPENPLHPAAELSDPASGRCMTVFTTEPALQLYTANKLCDIRGKGGRLYQPYEAVCLETQHYPNSMAHPEFPGIILKAGEHYDSETVLFFGLTEAGGKE